MLKFLSIPLSFTLFSLTLSLPLQADPINQLLAIKQQENNYSRQTQITREQIDDRKQQQIERYRQLSQELEQLKRYNRNMETMLSKQQQQQDQHLKKVTQIANTERHINPMMSDMVDALEQFIRLDLPFLRQERDLRIQNLKQLLQDPSLNHSNRFARILDAYQIESNYGRSLEAYQGKVTLSGDERTVTFLRVGRIGLYYLSLDGQQAGRWHHPEQQWQNLPTAQLASLQQGLLIAQKRATPDLINLPVSLGK
ncbi:MAG: DUF3450 domain-containing protein [Motiliproteus sp.]|nr:DUF3450 domain-containing protein [Motiliproteus sp.]MCW9054295.1 DUF3450 domain-containing protein [Motiliproteus sp.]